MSFVDIMLSLLTALLAVLVPIFGGHALAQHTTWPVIAAAAAGLAAVATGAITVRRIRADR